MDVEPSNLKSDEVVEFVPTFSVLKDEGKTWEVEVHAWVYEPEEDSLVRAMMMKSLGELLALREGTERARRAVKNLRPFVVDNESSKQIAFYRGTHADRTGSTASDGNAWGSVDLPRDDPAARGEGEPPWIELGVVLREGDERRFTAWSQLLPDEGVSVITDVDDTIRISEVQDKVRLLERTFIEPWEPVPGMAEVYARWAGQSAAFHYVSNAPLPLLGAIRVFVHHKGFPRGSLFLRGFAWGGHDMIKTFTSSDSHKRHAIPGIVGRFESRRFVLVGDTGERDPEIYAEVARRYPERVTAIFLRDPVAGGTPGLEARLERVFEGLPRERWAVFTAASELPERL